MIASTVYIVAQKPLDTRCLDSDCCQVTLSHPVYCNEPTLMSFFFGAAVMTAKLCEEVPGEHREYLASPLDVHEH